MTALSPRLKQVARRLRRNSTEAERALWAALRARSLTGAKFRRQAPFGPFVVDFLCAEARLVVEVDGGQHAGSATDAARDALIARQGWRVLRYWNHEVLANRAGVLADIVAHLSSRRPLTPTLSPLGRGSAISAVGAAGRHREQAVGAAPPLPAGGEGRGEGAVRPALDGAP